MAGFWEFPGGKRREGEGRETALARELAEELGIEILRAQPLLDLVHDYPERSVHLDVWSILCYEGEPEPREGQVIDWVDVDALDELGLLPADEPIVVKLRDLRASSADDDEPIALTER